VDASVIEQLIFRIVHKFVETFGTLIDLSTPRKMSCSITLASTLSCLATSAQIRWLDKSEAALRGRWEQLVWNCSTVLRQALLRVGSLKIPWHQAVGHAAKLSAVLFCMRLPGTSAECEDPEHPANPEQ